MNRTDTMRTIYFAIILSTVIYAVIAWAATNQRLGAQSLTAELQTPLTMAIYALALGMYIAAFLVSARMPQIRVRWIVRWALLEAVAVLGILAAMLHGDWRLYLPPWVLALIGFSRSFPHRNEDRGTMAP